MVGCLGRFPQLAHQRGLRDWPGFVSDRSQFFGGSLATSTPSNSFCTLPSRPPFPKDRERDQLGRVAGSSPAGRANSYPRFTQPTPTRVQPTQENRQPTRAARLVWYAAIQEISWSSRTVTS